MGPWRRRCKLVRLRLGRAPDFDDPNPRSIEYKGQFTPLQPKGVLTKRLASPACQGRSACLVIIGDHFKI